MLNLEILNSRLIFHVAKFNAKLLSPVPQPHSLVMTQLDLVVKLAVLGMKFNVKLVPQPHSLVMTQLDLVAKLAVLGLKQIVKSLELAMAKVRRGSGCPGQRRKLSNIRLLS